MLRAKPTILHENPVETGANEKSVANWRLMKGNERRKQSEKHCFGSLLAKTESLKELAIPRSGNSFEFLPHEILYQRIYSDASVSILKSEIFRNLDDDCRQTQVQVQDSDALMLSLDACCV